MNNFDNATRLALLFERPDVGPKANRHTLLKPGSLSDEGRLMEHRITIVDDEGEVRSALGRLFKVAGMNTESYASAEEFLDSFSGRSCDCLIPDHGLPGMSCLEPQRRLDASHRRLPIIFASARDDDRDHTRFEITKTYLAFPIAPCSCCCHASEKQIAVFIDLR